MERLTFDRTTKARNTSLGKCCNSYDRKIEIPCNRKKVDNIYVELK